MPDILTVTLNPALDLATSAPKVEPGPKLRCAPASAEPGGGGVNVARAVALMGGSARAMVALGGPNGQALAGLLAREGVEVVEVAAPGETRLSFAVTDDRDGSQYRFVLPGPEWTRDQLDALLSRLAAEAAPGAFVVLSGSLPPGAPDDFMARASTALGPDRHVIADTSGRPLAVLAEGGSATPDVLRMDSHEAEELAGTSLPTAEDSADFAASLVARGAGRRVIVARGAEGSVMVGPEGRWKVSATNDSVVSAIGAGDSFVGGFVLGLSRGDSYPEALKLGAAAASSAVMTEGTQLCRREDVERLFAVTRLTQL